MGLITLPTTFVDNTVPTAAQFNGDFQAILDVVNGNIGAANVNTGEIVTLTGTQKLTNKTPIPVVTSYTPGAGETATLNLAAGNVHAVTMPAGNITLAITGATVGQCFILELTQDSGGSRTVTWFSTIKWAGGTAPTLTTTASKRDTFGFRVTGSGTYDGYIVGQSL